MLPLSFAEAIDADIQAQQDLDDALDILMNGGNLSGVLAPVLEPLFNQVNDGVNPSELLGALAELYPQMNADDLQERLARIMFVATVWGVCIARQRLNLAYCMTLPPKRAISYLKSKGYSFTWDWEEMAGCPCPRLYRRQSDPAGYSEDIRSALQQALDEGKTDRWFRQQLEPELQRKGCGGLVTPPTR